MSLRKSSGIPSDSWGLWTTVWKILICNFYYLHFYDIIDMLLCIYYFIGESRVSGWNANDGYMIEAAGVRYSGRWQITDLRMRHDDGVYSAYNQLFANVQSGFDRVRIHFYWMSVKCVAGFHKRRVEVEMLYTSIDNRKTNNNNNWLHNTLSVIKTLKNVELRFRTEDSRWRMLFVQSLMMIRP